MNRLVVSLLAALLLGAAADAQIPQPIAGAGDWKLVERLPGVAGPVCSIRINGPEADTMVLLNRGQVPLLAAGRADWSGLLGEIDASLSIDGAAPIKLRMNMFNNLVMVLLSDPQLLRRLRAAKSLDWTFPFGRYRANVAGMAVALDTLSACTARHPAPAATPATG